MFEQVFVDTRARTRRPAAVALSFSAQVVLIASMVLLPLWRTEAIVPNPLLRILIPPPRGIETQALTPEAHSPNRRTGTTAPRVFVPHLLTQPSRIPDRVLIGPIEPPAMSAGSGEMASTGVSNGIPGGIADQMPRALPPPKISPPATPPKSQAPIRVGGQVQAAKIRHQVMPVYPPLARAARIAGAVHLEAIIARDGAVRSLRVIGGHPLLVPAAVEAVEQWTYYPTLLNTQPVEVLTEIEVNFKLAE